ncbi:MAG: AraC family transcriptional regulator [Anaerolineae bacterium]|nr:AraC family transcriptional regulator [Gemmatimonadaceae bacterium]
MTRSILNVASGAMTASSGPPVQAGDFWFTRASLAPRATLPPHAHERATINFVVKGCYRESVDSGGYSSHSAFTFVAKPAGAVHSNALGDAPAECLVIEASSAGLERLRDRRELLTEVCVARGGLLTALGLRATRELSRLDDLSALSLEGIALELVAALTRSVLLGGQRPASRRDRWLERVRQMLHDESIVPPLGEIARIVDLHPVYLARAFRARFGCSVGEYARALRADRAQALLMSTNLGVSEIAHRTGYSDQSHLARDTHRRVGMSPGGLRRLARNA